jgi:hypothetical protein
LLCRRLDPRGSCSFRPETPFDELDAPGDIVAAAAPEQRILIGPTGFGLEVERARLIGASFVVDAGALWLPAQTPLVGALRIPLKQLGLELTGGLAGSATTTVEAAGRVWSARAVFNDPLGSSLAAAVPVEVDLRTTWQPPSGVLPGVDGRIAATSTDGVPVVLPGEPRRGRKRRASPSRPDPASVARRSGSEATDGRRSRSLRRSPSRPGSQPGATAMAPSAWWTLWAPRGQRLFSTC